MPKVYSAGRHADEPQGEVEVERTTCRFLSETVTGLVLVDEPSPAVRSAVAKTK